MRMGVHQARMQQATRGIDDRGIIWCRHAARTNRDNDTTLHKYIGLAEEAGRIQDEPASDYQRSVCILCLFVHVDLTRAE